MIIDISMQSEICYGFLEVKGKRKRGRPKKTRKMQVEKESKSVGLEEDDMN